MYNLNNVYKSYDKEKTFVISNLSLSFNQGDFIAIIGKSGSGKTTLLNLLSTIDLPDRGLYVFNEQNLNKLSLDALALFRNKHIGVVFQEYNLIPEYTIKQNILLPTVFSKVKQNNAFDEIVEKLGIGHLLDKKAKLLSGGEQQRVAVARAIINKPSLVLADEPTGNLDPDNAEQLYEMLKNINQSGTTVIIVTHNLAMAERFNTVYELKSGQLVKLK